METEVMEKPGNPNLERHEYIRPEPKPRIQVRVSHLVRQTLEPIFGDRDRKGAPLIVSIAEDITLLEALRLLNEEERVRGVPTVNLWVTPSDKLLEKAQEYYIMPHVLVRAAAVKLAQEIKAGATPLLVK